MEVCGRAGRNLPLKGFKRGRMAANGLSPTQRTGNVREAAGKGSDWIQQQTMLAATAVLELAFSLSDQLQF